MDDVKIKVAEIIMQEAFDDTITDAQVSWAFSVAENFRRETGHATVRQWAVYTLAR